MIRILVTGSRNWSDVEIVESALSNWWHTLRVAGDVTLVHGACPTGADHIADEIWTRWGQSVERHPADWRRHGRVAGPLRNQEMVDLGANVVLGFPLGDSPGTRGCMDRARLAGLTVINYGEHR